ncbi:MAG TPA: hypothetical protein VMO80_10920 [Terriglobales bacterium]|nr:hypothetical protein [Terriglobales bacterium]
MSNMWPLDFMVGANFRDENASRIVVFPGDRRHRGYLVKSEAEELKIRSFLKMFYFAHSSILLLGILLSSVWSTEINHLFGRPDEHVIRTVGIFIGIYFLVVALPYLLLWRSYKQALLSFVSTQDEVVVSEKSANQQRLLFVGVGVIAFAVLMMFGVFLLVRAKQ